MHRGKFFADDCAGIRAALAGKNRAQVEETISRYSWTPTKKQMRDACQLDGLFSPLASDM